LLSTHAPASFSQETFDALFAQLSAEIFGSPIDVASLIDQPTTEEENVLNQQRETLPPSVQDLLADSHTPFRTSLIFKFAERNASKLTDTMVGLLRDVRNCVFDNEMQVRKINTDVEELCAMEPSLRPRLQRMMTVLDGLQFPAFVTTNRGLLYRFNDAFAAVSRYSREELEQPNFFALELFENECVSSLMEAYVRAIQDTKLETVTHRPILKRRDNRRVETVGAMSMVRDSSGAIIATMTICIPLDGASVGPSS
jgi:PAS domain-containing protein